MNIFRQFLIGYSFANCTLYAFLFCQVYVVILKVSMSTALGRFHINHCYIILIPNGDTN